MHSKKHAKFLILLSNFLDKCLSGWKIADCIAIFIRLNYCISCIGWHCNGSPGPNVEMRSKLELLLTLTQRSQGLRISKTSIHQPFYFQVLPFSSRVIHCVIIFDATFSYKIFMWRYFAIFLLNELCLEYLDEIKQILHFKWYNYYSGTFWIE